MRITIRNLPYDIILCQIWTIIAISSLFLDTHPAFQFIIGLPIILIIPGYLLLLILFPKNTKHKDIDGIERLIYSFGISFAVLSLLGILLYYTPGDLKTQSIFLAVFLMVLILGTISYVLYHRTLSEEPYFVSYTIQIFRDKTTFEKILTVILIILLLITSSFFIFLTSFHQINESLTEFYLFDENGSLLNHPKQLGYNQNVTGIIGISNHEYKTINYSIGIWLINKSTQQTDYKNESSQIEEKLWLLEEKNIVLPHTEPKSNTLWRPQWQYPFSIPIQKSGKFQLHFLLYKNKTALSIRNNITQENPELLLNSTDQRLSLNLEIGYTEFIVLNQTGSTPGTMRNITLGENISGMIGLSNHEYTLKNYTLDLWLALHDEQLNTSNNLFNITCSEMLFIKRNTYRLNHTKPKIININQPQTIINYSIPTNLSGFYTIIAILNERPMEPVNLSINYCELIKNIVESSYKFLIINYNVI